MIPIESVSTSTTLSREPIESRLGLPATPDFSETSSLSLDTGERSKSSCEVVFALRPGALTFTGGLKGFLVRVLAFAAACSGFVAVLNPSVLAVVDDGGYLSRLLTVLRSGLTLFLLRVILAWPGVLEVISSGVDLGLEGWRLRVTIYIYKAT